MNLIKEENKIITALLLGRKGSIGFPGKNLYPVLGRPLAWYPMNAALKATTVNRSYLSTDDERLMDLAKECGLEIIERPPHLCTKEALGEDAFVHGYKEICRKLGKAPELIVLMFCNAATVLSDTIDKGVKVLRENSGIDSAVSVSRYNMWSPIRARRIDNEGLLKPFVSFEQLPGAMNINCDRDSYDDAWFADVAVSVVRPQNLEHIGGGLPPQRWMGRNIYPLRQEAGCDVDYEWQISVVEWWLKRYGGFDDK